jgi:hypothetical protein
MSNKIGQLAFILILAAVPVYIFSDIATRFAAAGVNTGSAENNAAMYPRLIAILMTGLLVVQAVRTLRLPPEDNAGPALSVFIKKNARAIVVFFIFLAYLWAFRWFGFIYSTPVFLLLTQISLGYRSIIGLVAYPVGVTAGVFFVFAKILNLALPAGDFFG